MHGHEAAAVGNKKGGGANPNKWQAQISSGFDALIGFASSELDRSKEMRRKSVDSSDRSPSHGGVGTGSFGSEAPPATTASMGVSAGPGGGRNKNGRSPSGGGGSSSGGMAVGSTSAPESALRAALSGGFN